MSKTLTTLTILLLVLVFAGTVSVPTLSQPSPAQPILPQLLMRGINHSVKYLRPGETEGKTATLKRVATDCLVLEKDGIEITIPLTGIVLTERSESVPLTIYLR
jgi:hypothetical protein